MLPVITAPQPDLDLANSQTGAVTILLICDIACIQVRLATNSSVLTHHGLCLLQGSAAARPVFEQVLESCQGPGKLHPMHVRIFDCYMPAANGCRRTGDSIGAIKHVIATINAMEFYYSCPCIEVTNLYRFLTELFIDWASNAPSTKLATRPKRQAKETFQKFCALKAECQGSSDTDEDLTMRMRLL